MGVECMWDECESVDNDVLQEKVDRMVTAVLEAAEQGGSWDAETADFDVEVPFP